MCCGGSDYRVWRIRLRWMNAVLTDMMAAETCRDDRQMMQIRLPWKPAAERPAPVAGARRVIGCSCTPAGLAA